MADSDHSLDHMTQWQCRKCNEVLWDDDEHDCSEAAAAKPAMGILLFLALYFTALVTITIVAAKSCG